jgi:hypothetical protein
MQLRDRLGSPGVELGVDRVRTLVVVYSSRWRFAGARTPSFTVGESRLEGGE